MDEKSCTELLTAHGIRPTVNRLLAAKALAAAGRPMSLSELEAALVTVDKSGLSRALSLFREHHLVHIVESSEGVRYELCMSHHADSDDDVHAHFFCERCHRTFCIDDVPVPPIDLPDGYRQTSVTYIARGICPECGIEVDE